MQTGITFSGLALKLRFLSKVSKSLTAIIRGEDQSYKFNLFSYISIEYHIIGDI